MPAFINWNTNFWTVTSTSTATKSIWVASTNADRLTISNLTGTISANAGNPNPPQTPGVINFLPGSNASTSSYTVTLSNSTSGLSVSTNLTIVVGPLKPLQIRVVDLRSDTTQPFQILPVDTGDTQGGRPNGSSFWYVNGGTTNYLNNGYSVGKTSLPAGTTNNPFTDNVSVPYYTMFLSNVASGTLWIAYTDQPYTNALHVGNPGGTAASTVQWSQVPFGEVELSYTGGGYDTADMTFINVISVPTMLRFSSNGSTTLQGPKGVTNASALTNAIANLWSQPGVAWYGAVTSTVAGQPNTNIIRLVGPASASKGGVQMPSGGASTNATTPQVITAGNYVDGWPGFSAASLSRYVSSVAENTTNNGLIPGTSTPWGRTKIFKQIGDPGATWSGGSQWFFTAELTFVPNTNPISSGWSSLHTNYLTPIPVLTNITITNVWTSKTDANVITTNGYAGPGTNVSIHFTPDSGHPTNTWFTSYIYNAPPSFNNGVNSGYATFYVNGQTNEAWWTGLASYPNSGQSRTASANFTAYVLDAFLNEIAFGFNAGFVQSPVKGWTNGWTKPEGQVTGNTNTGSPDTVIGTMNSDQWWDQTNGIYRLNRGTPDDGFYCAYGNGVFSIGETIYSHAISDRMRYNKFTPGMPLSEANTNSAAIMEIYIRDVALPATPTGARPTVTGISTNGVLSTFYQYQPQTWSANIPSPAMPNPANMIVLQLTNAGAGPSQKLQPQVQFPNLVVQAANTNGGGVYVGSLPAGLTWDPVNLTVTGTIISPDNTNNTGQMIFGLSAYSSNDATLTSVPLWVLPVDTTPSVTNVIVTNNYPRPPNVGAVAFPGETITLQGTNFMDWDGSVTPVNQVLFANGLTTTNFTIVDASTITVTVPTNWTTTTGFVGSVAAQRVWTNMAAQPPTVITNGSGWTHNFGIPMPLVTGFASTGGAAITRGSPGSSVVLQGFFYGATNVVFLANGTATNVAVTAPASPYTNLTVTVPTPSGSLPQVGTVAVDVLYTNLTPTLSTNASSTNSFTITPPVEKPSGPLNQSHPGVNQFQPVVDSSQLSYAAIYPWATPSVSSLMLQVTNYTNAMTTDAQASYAATGLPRGLWVTNVVEGTVVNGYIIGAPIDPTNNAQITVTATNSAGSTNLTFTLKVHSYSSSYSAPSLVGTTSFSATLNTATNLLVDYTNSPTYFEVSGLPSGMTNLPVMVETVVTPMPQYPTFKETYGHFALAITGTPTVSGPHTVTIKAVNVTSAGPTTNTSNITITVAGSGGGGGGGSGFATWGGGSLPAAGTEAYTNALLRYAFGGGASYDPTGAQTNFGTGSLSNISGFDYLVLREIIRTNDPNLNVWSEHTTNLTNSTWTSNNLPPTPSADQTGATAGTQAQDFKTPQGSDERKFLRLKATYQNP